tara:strand:+ start:216 stop:581 length:366 start_codon:yes stop_codon:yes gene_type:complete
VNDYQELQKIYEGYPAYNDVGPNAKYEPNEAPPRQSFYRRGQLPVGYPGGSGYSAYNYNQARSGYIVDEEIKAAEILNLDVIKKIEELQDEADEDGMSYANMLLGKLKEYIKDDLTPTGKP